MIRLRQLAGTDPLGSALAICWETSAICHVGRLWDGDCTAALLGNENRQNWRAPNLKVRNGVVILAHDGFFAVRWVATSGQLF